MAKVLGTIAVNAITGRVGGMIFYHVKGRPGETYVRAYNPRVAQPRTPLQLRNRALMIAATELWRGLGLEEQAFWAGRCRTGQRARNVLFGYVVKQSIRGWMPHVTPYNEHKGTPPAPTALLVRVAEGALRVTWTDAAGALTTGIHAGVSPDFAPEMRNLVWCTAAQPGVPRTATITLGAGVYYLRARSGALDGGTGTATTAVGPVEIG
jgi:hypothetical protein